MENLGCGKGSAVARSRRIAYSPGLSHEYTATNYVP